MRPFIKVLVTALLTLVLSIAVAGCSDDDNPPEETTTTSPVGS